MSKSESAPEFRRRRAIELIEEGEDLKIISRVLGVTLTTLYRWRTLGRSILIPRTQAQLGGRPRLVPASELDRLERLLLQGASSHGWPNDFWTIKRVRRVIDRCLGISVSYSTAHRILRRHLKWTPQRPVQRLGARNETEIERWRAEVFPGLKKSVQERGGHLIFMDESGFMLAPIIRRTYAPRGRTPVNKVSDPHGRISVAGAISISPTGRSLRFWWTMLQNKANFTGNAIAAFLNKLRIRSSRHFTIIWDSIPIHRSNAVHKYFSADPGIAAVSFPPYSPELNPVDRVWFYVKYHRLANYTPLSLSELRVRLRNEFYRIRKRSDLLKSFVRQTGLPLTQDL